MYIPSLSEKLQRFENALKNVYICIEIFIEIL